MKKRGNRTGGFGTRPYERGRCFRGKAGGPAERRRLFVGEGKSPE